MQHIGTDCPVKRGNLKDSDIELVDRIASERQWLLGHDPPGLIAFALHVPHAHRHRGIRILETAKRRD